MVLYRHLSEIDRTQQVVLEVMIGGMVVTAKHKGAFGADGVGLGPARKKLRASVPH